MINSKISFVQWCAATLLPLWKEEQIKTYYNYLLGGGFSEEAIIDGFSDIQNELYKAGGEISSPLYDFILNKLMPTFLPAGQKGE